MSLTEPTRPPEMAGSHAAFDPRHSGAEWTFAPASPQERRAAERFIGAAFFRAYGASLRQFFPLIMTLRHHGRLVAACGLRYAGVESLFLENYLDERIEMHLSARTDKRVERSGIVEVGNLAVVRGGYARQLIIRLTAHLREKDAAWAVFSAVPALRNSFRRLGVPVVPIAPAERHRLPAAQHAEWGSYYDARPVVTAVRVIAAHAALGTESCRR
jgi:hypothetical protein